MEQLMDVVGAALCSAFSLLGLLFLVRNFLYVCRPGEALIVTGRQRLIEGVDAGPLVVLPHGAGADAARFPGAGKGHVWRYPIIERIDHMDMRLMSIDIVVRDAYSKGNIPLQLHAIANVKIQSDPQLLRNAIERFLGRQRAEIQLVAQQTLEGAVREVLAQMTPEQVNEDRLAFASHLMTSAKDDLDKLGIQLDTLKIQNVQDSTGYLDSLGRPAIARALRDAENAESQALQETTQAEAMSQQRSEVARADAQTAVLRRTNELAKVKAELDGAAQAIEREAKAAAETARATAELELQRVRAVLEQKRLEVEVVIPAEVQRLAVGILARGEAAPTIENGKAAVEVLEATAAAWRAMGTHAREIYVIQHLEAIIGTVVSQLNVTVGEVSVLDRGDGSGLAGYAAAYPQTVAAVLRAIGQTTGVDVPAILAGKPGTEVAR
jgi:flotillin